MNPDNNHHADAILLTLSHHQYLPTWGLQIAAGTWQGAMLAMTQV